MRILLDENLPLPLRPLLRGHEVFSVKYMGWTGVQNGDLLLAAEGRFDVLLLADKNLRYQQNLRDRNLALVELSTNRWPLLKDNVQAILAAIDSARPGTYTILELPASST